MSGVEELAQTRQTIESFQYRWSSEKQLQSAIYTVLDGCFLHPQAEYSLTPAERIDFLCTHDDGTRIGVEVKIAGTAAGVMGQLLRYAPHVDALLLVTTRHRHASIPRLLAGKPLEVAIIGGHL